MKCPACQNTLTQRVVSGITLDVCDNGCGGIWFDSLELKKFDEPQEPDVETLLHLKRNPAVKINAGVRNCPKCQSYKLMRHFSSVKKGVVVDECPKCAGTWLDAGELDQIRHEFNTEEDRIKAAEKVFDEMFGKQVQETLEKDRAAMNKARNISSALRFICPSYYAPSLLKK